VKHRAKTALNRRRGVDVAGPQRNFTRGETGRADQYVRGEKKKDIGGTDGELSCG